MIRLTFKISFFVFVFSPHAEATTMEAIDKVTSLVKAVVPSDKAACLLGKVQDIIRPGAYGRSGDSVGGSNLGLLSYYQDKLDRDPCFAETAKKFWSEVKEYSAAQAPEISDSLSDDNLRVGLQKPPQKLGEVDQKISLPAATGVREKTGEGRFAKFKPGWLWEKALKAARGDSRVAMDILGMCMHDDIGMPMTAALDKSQMQARMQERLDSTQAQIKETIKKRASLDVHSQEWELLGRQISVHENNLSILQNIKSSGRTDLITPYFNCPSGISPVFAQGSIDSSFVLPQETVDRLEKIKGSKSLTEIGAKTYHFMAGAIVGCELSQCGVSAEVAKKTAFALATAYRAYDICPTIKSNIELSRKLADELGLPRKSPAFPEAARAALRKKFGPVTISMGAGTSTLKPYGFSFGEYQVTNLNMMDLQDPQIEKIIAETRDKAVERQLADFDAAQLFSNWYLGGPESPLPCTGLRTDGPNDLMQADNSKPGSSICQIKGWSAERCEKARQKLEDWDADFKWTQFQHPTGAAFGATQCASAVQKKRPSLCSGDILSGEKSKASEGAQ